MNMNRKGISLFQSLRFRLIASIVMIEVVMLSIMVWNNVDSIQQTQINRLIDTSNSLLQQFASSAGALMVQVDYAGLEDLAANILKQDEVTYLLVLDINQRLLLELGSPIPKVPPHPDTNPAEASDGIFDVATDIMLANRIQGRVLLGFSLKKMKADIARARNRSVLIAATEIFLSVFVTIFIGLGLTRNLHVLATAAARVGDGKFDTTIPVSREDEVGLTANAFNKMVDDLADRTRRIIESETRTRLLMDSTAQGIVGVDSNSRCMFINKSCLRILGFDSEDEFFGKSFHELVHYKHRDGRPYPAEECAIRKKAHSKDGVSYSDDEYYWRKDGSGFPAEVWTYPIVSDGNNIGYMISFVDLTDRKSAEAELERLNYQLQLLLESTGEGIFGVDTELLCTFVNKAAANMLGYTVSQMRGKDMHQLVQSIREDGSVNVRAMSPLYRCIQENRVIQSDEEVLWTREKEMIPTQYSASPISENNEVTGAVVVFRNVAEARALARKMDFLATHDALTGLVNRREFDLRLESALVDARDEDDSHVLCYLDLDQFKVVNDTCGHVAGDELLRQLTTLLHQRIRREDTLARLGGDEFGVLLRRCPLEVALKVIEGIRETVNEFRFVWEDKTFAIGMSAGLTVITPDTINVGTAMSEADAACYIAKDRGRNRVHIYELDDADLVKRHGEMHWVSRIHHALEEERFLLFGQPIIPIVRTGDNSTNEPTHIEILLRMTDESGQILPPGAFIPAAERYNLMPTVDRWVASTTLKWIAKQQERIKNIGFFTINVSGHTLTDKKFLDFVCQTLHELGIQGEKVCFEITETAAVANLTEAMKFMNTLKDRGCLFALDDFGSGMSSFAYLKSLPVDFLKIDGNFVRDIVEDRVDYEMVKAINQVGQVMGIKTVAEFVEDNAVLLELQKIGVDFAQGFGLAEPAPLEDIVNSI